MTQPEADTPSPGAPQRRRVRIDPPAGINDVASPKRLPTQPPYVANGGAEAAKQLVLNRLAHGWLTINDLVHACCWGRNTGQALFERLPVSSFEQIGLPGNESRSRFVRREDAEALLGSEGWRVVRSQQDEPEVREALLGNEEYPLLSKLLSWAGETPRRKLPLLDLALELGLTPSDAAFDLNREIDWADQAGLMRDALRRQERLAVATRDFSRPTTVTYDELIALDEWSEGKPFKDGTTRVLARHGRLEHLHTVMEGGEVIMYLLPRWAEILTGSEKPAPIQDYELLRSRMTRTGESRQFIDVATELGMLGCYKWGRGVFVEIKDIAEPDKLTLLQILEDKKQQEKVESARRKSRVNANQTALLEEQLKALEQEVQGNNEQHERWLLLCRMATLGRMRADGQTLEACGLRLGVTRERIRQIMGKYERYALVVQSLEPRVTQALNRIDRHQPDLPACWTRLLKAQHSDTPFALFNQIFIEHHVYGTSLEGLYRPRPSLTTQPG